MPENNNSSRCCYLVGGLLLLWLILRGGSFGLSQNYSFDAVTRTTIAKTWLNEPSIIPLGRGGYPTQYAPLPIYLMGLSLVIWNQPLFAPRLLCLIFGCLTLLPFYYLVKLEFDRRNALYAGLFLACFSLHIKSSVVASSEAIFCFFLLCGVYYVYKFKHEKLTKWLILAALFMNLAAMSRYTGLFYIPLLSLLLIDTTRLKSSLRRAALFILLCLILPGLWLWLHHKAFGQALYPFKYILAEHAGVISRFRDTGGRLYYLIFWPTVVILSLTPVVAGLSLLGMWDRLRQKKHLGFLLLVLGPYILFMYRAVIVGNFFLMPRFVIDSSIFILPFAVIGMDKLQTRLPPPWQKRLPKIITGSAIAWLALVVILSHGKATTLTEKMRAVSPLSQLEPVQERIVSYLAQRKPGGKIIIDHNPTWGELEIMFYSGLPHERFITDITLSQIFSDNLKESQISYLILLPRGRLSQNLPHKQLKAFIRKYGIEARQLFKESGYRLYMLSPILGK